MSEAVALGIDIGGTNTKIGLVTRSGKLIAKETTSTPDSHSIEDVLRVIVQISAELISSNQVAIEGVGIGAPGVVDLACERVVEAPSFPTWDNIPLRKLISDALNLPAVMDNDVNAFGIGEHLWGAGVGLTDFIAIAIGTGVGGSIFINGELYRGATGAAGELGFTILTPDGPAVGGIVGVLEGYIGRRGFDREVAKLFPKGEFPTPRRITQMVRDDNPKAKQIQLLMAARLTEAAATWVHMLNPQAIIIGGGTMAESDFFYAELNNRLRARARRVHTRDLRILSGKLGYYAGMLGASALWYSSQKE
ncbi:ROK family protein [bacterium]|nr:ROK family protein [bacterium]